MSAPLMPAARTRTSTSPGPGSGSGCSSITISLSRTVAARIGGAVYAGAPGRVSGAMPLTPLWNEGRMGFEAADLLRSETWREAGTLDGRGRGVLLVPGFMAGDRTLGLMTHWLRRAGYRTRSAGTRSNIDCAGATLGVLEQRLEGLVERSGRSTAVVIGQSRGGSLARGAPPPRPGAARRPSP